MEPFNISVHTLEPGYFKTDVLTTLQNDISKRWEELDEEMKKDFGEEFLQKCEAIIVLGVHLERVFSETHVDSVVGFSCSEAEFHQNL